MSVDTWEDYIITRALWYYQAMIAEEHGPCRHWRIDPDSIPSNWLRPPEGA